MRRRVYGIETEYGIAAVDPITQRVVMDAEDAARHLFSSVTSYGRTTNLFLRNGGRMYLDVGSHPEYATAECDSVGQLVEQVRAGEQLFVQLAERAHIAISADNINAKILLFANNGDNHHNSYGCHENYLIHRRRDFHDTADALISFFITRIIVAGAGHISLDGPAPSYVFSHRAEHMWDAVSAATTRSRPIINTRDEPLADTTTYRRLHVIVGDTNIAESSTALKVGMTELLLTALEDGLDIRDLALAQPMSAIRTINRDLTATTPVELADGRSMSALQIQRTIYQRVQERLAQTELNDSHRHTFDVWRRALDALESGNWESIDTELDFAIKKKLIDTYQQRTGLALNDSRIIRLNMAYHDITTSGLRHSMENTGLMTRISTAQAVVAATHTPPSTTRAHLRGRFISAAQTVRANVFVDWQTLRCEDGLQTAVMLRDPLSTHNPQVDALIEKLHDSAPLLPA